MAHGGKRKGSGRKRGSANNPIDAEARKRAAESGLLPIDILLAEMRAEYEAVEVPRQSARDLPPDGNSVRHSIWLDTLPKGSEPSLMVALTS